MSTIQPEAQRPPSHLRQRGGGDMNGYEITLSITALCPCCGKELPSNSYLTESKATGHPLERDNPYERKGRRVFITPCADCFEPRQQKDTQP